MSSLYSSHIFMFPFRFDWNEKGFENKFKFYQENDIKNRLQIDLLDKKLKKGEWQYEKFAIPGKDEKLLYNEYAYFYDYARDAMYNLDEFDENSISNFYRKESYEGKTFYLEIKKENKVYKYKLVIDGVMLRVFHTGVAILSIELLNKEESQSDFEDIQRINDYARRLYPQYLGKDGIKNTKNSFLPNLVKIGDDEAENFEKESYDEIHIGKHILQVLGKDIFCLDKNKSGMFYIQPSLDDRMFVISWYGNDCLSKQLSTQYCKDNDWYRYVFIDNGDITVKNDAMKERLLCEATYARWSDYGTLFGVTRYSFVLLTSSFETLSKPYINAVFLTEHIKTMYFQFVILLLANRTSILRFSDEVAAIASKKGSITKLENLYDRYLTFYNRLYFKEVTHQDQGIELYDKALKQMKIPEHIEKLDGKFTKLFDYANLKQSNKESDAMNSLNLIVSALGVTGLFISIYSMGAFDFENSLKPFWWAVGSSVLAGAIALFGMYLYLKHAKEQ